MVHCGLVRCSRGPQFLRSRKQSIPWCVWFLSIRSSYFAYTRCSSGFLSWHLGMMLVTALA